MLAELKNLSAPIAITHIQLQNFSVDLAEKKIETTVNLCFGEPPEPLATISLTLGAAEYDALSANGGVQGPSIVQHLADLDLYTLILQRLKQPPASA